MYAASAQRQKARQAAVASGEVHDAPHVPPARVRRVEYGDTWYGVSTDGRRPGDPAAAVPYYSAPAKAVYQAAAPVRGDDVPAARPGKVLESADETVRQRFLAARATANVRWWFNLATFCAASGALFAVTLAEVLWADRSVPDLTTESLKWCILLSTMIGVAALFEYGTWYVKLRRAQGDFVPEGERYYHSLLRCGIYWEVATFIGLLCLIPVPSISYPVSVWDAVKSEYVVYSSDACAVALMLLVRTAFVVKCVVINDPLHAPCHALYAKSCNVDLSWRFILVVRLRESARHVLGFWLLSTITLSYCLTLAERPHDGGQLLNDTDSQLGIFHNSLWFTIVTLTSVGYGDMHPQTVLGGLFAIVSCTVSVVLVACSINIVMLRIALDDSSKRVLALTELARQNTAVRRQAVRCIERLYLLSPVYRKLHSDALPRLKFGGRAAVKELKAAHAASDTMVC